MEGHQEEYREEIEKLIEYGYETDFLDFKAIQYKDKTALLKDVLAMANSNSSQTKYILCGIKADSANNKTIIGISENDFKDSSEIQQLIYSNIEPDLHIEYLPLKYKEALIGVIRIGESPNKPYMMKKKNGTLEKGICYVRKGSQQSVASREDFDRFYFLKEEVDVSIMEDCLFVTGDQGLGRCRVLFKNYSTNPTTILGGVLIIYNQVGEVVSKHSLYGFDKKYYGADFNLMLSPKTEYFGEGIFGFSSTDCLRHNMTSMGIAEGKIAELKVWDSSDREHVSTSTNYSIFVKGAALWKVELKEIKEHQEQYKKADKRKSWF